jgi:phosphocarrier protein
MNNTVTQEFIVENEQGLHARPSASFVKKANEFDSDIEVVSENGEIANGKSIISLLCLTAGKGSKLTITAQGSDAKEAIYALGYLFKTKFNEN